MKKVLVTGGAGFIGSHLVRALTEREYHVIVIDNLLRGNKIDTDILDKIELHVADVRDYTTVVKLAEKCDSIFHFAAILGVDIVADNPIETMDTEIIGTRNVAEASMLCGVQKVIYASTSGIYGHSAISKSVTENMQLDPRTSYAIAKRYNEIYLSACHEEKGLNSICLRFFNVYGIKQDERMVIPKFFKQAMKGQPITVYGSGSQTRDFTSVSDTVRSCIQVAEKVEGFEIFNVANENEFSIFNLARLIKEVTGSKSEILKINAPAKRYDFEVERRFGCSDKLYSAIGFKPCSDLREGLEEIYLSMK